MKHIVREEFLAVPMVLPPLPEQHRIAAVLSVIQRDIAAQDAVIAEMHETKRSLMQRLFTYGAGETPAPTKITEIGELPEHWEAVALGPYCGISTGTTPATDGPSYYDGTNFSLKQGR